MPWNLAHVTGDHQGVRRKIRISYLGVELAPVHLPIFVGQRGLCCHLKAKFDVVFVYRGESVEIRSVGDNFLIGKQFEKQLESEVQSFLHENNSVTALVLGP